MIAIFFLLLVQAAQNPSPMSDSTRPHPRVAQYEPAGRRVGLSLGTAYIPPAFSLRERHALVVHFHGAPWLVEHHVRSRLPQAVLVTVQLGAGSRVYADAFSEDGRLTRLIDEVSEQVGVALGGQVRFDLIALTSFSAGYGAVRSILRHPDQYRRVDAVLLADSLHAGYASETGGTRTVDLPVTEADLKPFLALARDALAGRKRLLINHSEVFPGTYASTTETADVLIRDVGLTRRPLLRAGPIGMQNLSEAKDGQFHVRGFAGNSAPDHMDHLYALGEYLRPLTAPLPRMNR